MITKETAPYEFLARWRNGVFVGAHVQFLTRLIEDGIVLNEQISEAMPVDVGGGKGFPLADLISTMQADALVALDAKTAEAATKTTELAAAQQAIVTKDAELTDKEAELQRERSDRVQAEYALAEAMAADPAK